MGTKTYWELGLYLVKPLMMFVSRCVLVLLVILCLSCEKDTFVGNTDPSEREAMILGEWSMEDYSYQIVEMNLDSDPMESEIILEHSFISSDVLIKFEYNAHRFNTTGQFGVEVWGVGFIEPFERWDIFPQGDTWSIKMDTLCILFEDGAQFKYKIGVLSDSLLTLTNFENDAVEEVDTVFRQVFKKYTFVKR